MQVLTHYFKALYHSLIFWPLCLSLAFLAVAVITIEIDHAFKMGEYVPSLTVVDESTAVTLLGALLSGLMTLVVFSFTMMMTIFNQASSKYSPRLVTSFIARRSYQLILGYYVGSIVYVIIVIFNIGSYTQTTPEFSVLIAVLFGVSSLGVFVYFLNSVSQSMLVTNLIQAEYSKALKTIKRLDDSAGQQTDIFENTLISYKVGYEYDVDLDEVQLFADKYAIDVQIPAPGISYYHQKPILAYTSAALSDEQKEALLKTFAFYTPPQSSLSFETNMRRIEEVGVKAMSPSISDPGTAVLAIDYLTELFVLRSYKKNTYAHDSEKTNKVYLLHLPFDDLINLLFTHFYEYAKSDPDVSKRLMISLQHIEQFGDQSATSNIDSIRLAISKLS